VVFQSYASNLAGGGTGSDIFWRDMRTGSVRLVSSRTGVTANGSSWTPVASSNGRYVAYASSASNLVAGDANGWSDVFRWDSVTGATVRVSRSSGDGESHSPSISSNGRYIAFVSAVSAFVPSDTAGFDDVYRKDLVTGAMLRVSVAPNGAEPNGDCFAPSVSSSGRYVAFCSSASNIVAGDTNGATDVFVFDTVLHTTRRASVSSTGVQGNHGSFAPAISGDGLKVAFESRASNLVAGDTNAVRDIFVRYLSAGSTVRASVGYRGQGTAESREPSIDYSGARVAFTSDSAFTSNDAPGTSDAFVRDMSAKTTTRLYQGASAALTSDGRHAIFTTSRRAFVGGTSAVRDIVSAAFGPRPIDRVNASTPAAVSALASKRAGAPTSKTVVIANYATWQEALAASSLCGVDNAPLLLVSSSGGSTAVMTEISRIKPKRIFVVGPAKSISTALITTLRRGTPGVSVTRIYGKNKYSTGNAVATAAVRRAGARWDRTVFVVNGRTYGGAASAAAIAALKGRPFVLVNPKTGSFTLPTGTKRALILGTTKQVSKKVAARLIAKLGRRKVSRIGVADRNSMAAAVAKYGVTYCAMTYDRLSICNLARPTESIAGAVLAGRCGSVVLGANRTSLPSVTSSRLTGQRARADLVRIIGSTGSISSSVLSRIRRVMGG